LPLDKTRQQFTFQVNLKVEHFPRIRHPSGLPYLPNLTIAGFSKKAMTPAAGLPEQIMSNQHNAGQPAKTKGRDTVPTRRLLHLRLVVTTA